MASNDNNKPISRTRRSILKGIVSGGGIAAASPLVRAMDRLSEAELAAAKSDLANAIEGRAFWKGDDSYEAARGSTAYRVNKPMRYPTVVVQPRSAQDVVEAVRVAAKLGIKVTTRSGGHSWSASHIRDDVMLIDMSPMQAIDVDPDSHTFWTSPAVRGQYLNSVLGQDNLIVPTAHHPSPGIGGFVMNGGWGWNWRLWGNGAHHLRAIDVVTADGELIRADETQNSDYLWAARGSGQGFFGVVTNMHLDCHRIPDVWKTSVYVYNEDVIEDLFAWAREMVDEFPPHIEVIASSTAYDRETGGWAPIRMTLAGLAITDDEEEADAALDLMKTCPVNDKAYFKIENQPTDLSERYRLGYAADPAGHRFTADNCYTEAPGDVLAPRLQKVFTGHPSPRTHVFYMSGGQVKPLDIDKMALSVEGSVFIGAYTLWTDPAQDEEMQRWPVDQMMLLDDISTGGQMNDENMLAHPQDYFSKEAYQKLEALRAKHDPDGVFESFLGIPQKPA